MKRAFLLVDYNQIANAIGLPAGTSIIAVTQDADDLIENRLRLIVESDRLADTTGGAAYRSFYIRGLLQVLKAVQP